MNVYEKRALVSFLGSLGVIAIVAGIFLDGLEFIDGLIIAVALFIISGAAATWLGVQDVDDKSLPPKVRSSLAIEQRRSLVSLIAGSGVVVVLMGIFTPWFDFGDAIVLAIALFLFSGVAATYLGVKGEHHYAEPNAFQERPYYTERPVTGQSPSYKPEQEPYPGEPSPKARIQASKFCPACGAEQQSSDDSYCYSCGTKLN